MLDLFGGGLVVGLSTAIGGFLLSLWLFGGTSDNLIHGWKIVDHVKEPSPGNQEAERDQENGNECSSGLLETQSFDLNIKCHSKVIY